VKIGIRVITLARSAKKPGPWGKQKDEEKILMGKFLNYGITWADCEKNYGELISKPSIVEAVRTNLALRDEVLRAANAIINKLKNP